MTFIDTHCHLNFKAFEGGAPKIIRRAIQAGVSFFIIPGTDIKTSEKAVNLSLENKEAYAVVGIHPHHIYDLLNTNFDENLKNHLGVLEKLLKEAKVLGIGEVGLDKHTYYSSRHGDGIKISKEDLTMQEKLFLAQCNLAAQYAKSVVIHNREAKDELILLIEANKDLFSKIYKKVVLHCCEAECDLLQLAKKYGFYIGVDGDVTYDKNKREFIKNVPIEMLVLETDAPYILPEPLRSEKKYPNVPANIPIIAQSVADIYSTSVEEVAKITTNNAFALFGLS